MHLLRTQPGGFVPDDGIAHLAQTPAELVILCSGDSHLALLAEAARELPADYPSLRLANPMQLQNHASVDLYVDYSGTLWATVMKRTDEPPEREAMLAEIGRVLEREHGVVLVGALGFENAYALAMRRVQAEEIGAQSVGDLVPHAGEMTIGGS